MLNVIMLSVAAPTLQLICGLKLITAAKCFTAQAQEEERLTLKTFSNSNF
jgi:hypothetical protein